MLYHIEEGMKNEGGLNEIKLEIYLHLFRSLKLLIITWLKKIEQL